MSIDGVPTTFQRIQSAALETFAEHGFQATGIREVAERAGIPTSLLYHYSRSKSQLLRILVEDGLRRLVEADRRAIEMYANPADQLAALVAVHVFVHAQNPQLARLLDTELRVLDSEDRSAVLDLRDEVDLVWTEVLENAIKAGVIDVPDASITRLALIRMCNGVATWYSPAGRLAVSTVARRFGEMALGACHATIKSDLDLKALQRLVKAIHEGMPGPSPGRHQISPQTGVERRSK